MYTCTFVYSLKCGDTDYDTVLLSYSDIKYPLFDRFWFCSTRKEIGTSQHKLWFVRVHGARGDGGKAV